MSTSSTPNLKWFKATLSSSSSSCVEVAEAGHVVLVRDSKFLRDPRNRRMVEDQPTISIPVRHWRCFLNKVLSPETAGGSGIPSIEHAADGSVRLRQDGITLVYTSAEWDAFLDGISKGEFDRLAASAA